KAVPAVVQDQGVQDQGDGCPAQPSHQQLVAARWVVAGTDRKSVAAWLPAGAGAQLALLVHDSYGVQVTRPRLIALGASNLTRCLPMLLRVAAANAQGPVEVFAALGMGRSYGMRSRLLWRELPGLQDCGLWSALQHARATTQPIVDPAALPTAPLGTTGIIT